MSNPLSIQAGLTVHGSGGVGVPFRGGASPQSSVAQTAKPAQVFVNPTFRFDPSIGLVVIEFHDNTGTVTNSIPTQRQLQAYRTHQQTPPGEQTPVPQAVHGKTAAG
jgi:hypothetical protein